MSIEIRQIMKYKPNKLDIIDYLSEEMSEERKIYFEAYLTLNPSFQEDVKAMSVTKETLKKVVDEEVKVPVFIGEYDNTAKQMMPASLWYVLAIAASLTLLMLVGYTTGLVIKYDNGSFSMLYGGSNGKADVNTDYFSKEEAHALLVKQEQSRKLLLEQIKNLETKLEQNIETQLVAQKTIKQPASKANNAISEEQMLVLVTQLRKENQEMIGELYTLSAKEQEQQLQRILSNFYLSVGEQRNEDLELIQTKLSEIKYDSDIKQEQTDQILASIITTVKNQNQRGL